MDTQAFLEQFHKTDAFSRALGIRVRTLRPDLVEAEMDAGADKQNYMGHLHGGAYFSLCDVAAGLCASANGEQCVTLDASIHYLRGVTGGKILGRATPVRRGRRICVCSLQVSSENGALLATGTFTMYMTGVPINF